MTGTTLKELFTWFTLLRILSQLLSISYFRGGQKLNDLVSIKGLLSPRPGTR